MAVVLVVNDDTDMLDMYESMLSTLGHEPIAKEKVASGPETVREVGADALVVDLQQPHEDDYGLRLIEEVRADEETRAIPIILCTGAAEAVVSLRPRLDALGVPVVVKPFSMDELEQTLRDVLER
jgi:CheY-like chemotaxis protein